MKSLVIVDVQQLFRKHIPDQLIGEIVDYAVAFDSIYYIYDTLSLEEHHEFHDMYDVMLENDVHIKMKKIGKEYGFLRSWMDGSVTDEAIVAALELMLSLGKSDSRDLDPEDLQAIEKEADISLPHDDPIWIPEDLKDSLESVPNGSILVGGARNECLKEIELLLTAMGKNPEINEDYTYG